MIHLYKLINELTSEASANRTEHKGLFPTTMIIRTITSGELIKTSLDHNNRFQIYNCKAKLNFTAGVKLSFHFDG